MDRYILNFVFCFLLLLSCTERNTSREEGGDSFESNLNHIDIVSSLEKSVGSFNLSDAVEKVDIVKLELTEHSLVGDVGDVFIGDNDIFVVDNKTGILRFSKEGKFLNAISKKGQGPHEYLSVPQLVVNENTSLVYLLTTRGVKIFDYEGHYIKSIPNTSYEELFFSPNGRVLFTGRNFFLNNQLPLGFPNKDLWTLALIDSAFCVQKTFYNPAFIPYEKEIRGKAGMGNKLVRDQWTEQTKTLVDFYHEDLNIIYYGGDTIYKFVDESLKPHCVLDLGVRPSFEMSHEWLKKMEFFSYLWLYDFYATRDYLYFVLGKSEDLYIIRYDKKNGTTRTYREKGEIVEMRNPAFTHRRFKYKFELSNDLIGGKFAVNYKTSKYWCNVLYPFDILESWNVKSVSEESVKDSRGKDKYLEILKKLKEEDNPVLVIATLK